MSSSSRKRTDARGQAGQSLAELAITAPILLTLMMGAVNVGVLLSDKVVAGYASRQGARMASQLGAGVNGMTTSQIDQQVVRAVLASAKNLNFATVDQIDIYWAKTNADGSFNPSDERDTYDGSGSVLAMGFPSTDRNQTTPNEVSIGVRILWTYRSPTGSYGINVQTGEYAVMKAAPLAPG